MRRKASDILSFAQQDPVLPRAAQETVIQAPDSRKTFSLHTNENIRSKPLAIFHDETKLLGPCTFTAAGNSLVFPFLQPVRVLEPDMTTPEAPAGL